MSCRRVTLRGGEVAIICAADSIFIEASGRRYEFELNQHMGPVQLNAKGQPTTAAFAPVEVRAEASRRWSEKFGVKP